MRRRLFVSRLLCWLTALGVSLPLWSGSAVAASSAVVNLDEDVPTALEDAIPTEPDDLNVQGAIRYRGRVHEHREQVALSPEVQYGVAPGWQLSISVPFSFAATQEEAGSRNLRLRALYQFVQERRAWPAVAASARAELPTGLRSAGVDTRVKFLATKTLGPPPTQDQLHLNVAWLHNAGGHREEREHYYSLVAGYSRVLNLRSLLLLDYAREQEQERDITTDIFEIGVRRLVGQHIVLGVGIGAGLDATSPPVRFSVAVQYGF